MRRGFYTAAILACLGSVFFLSCKTQPAAPERTVVPAKRILGISPWSNPNYQMIKEAGIGWVRLGFAFPYKDKIGGTLSEDFLKDLAEAKKVHQLGLKIMGVTPLAGVMDYNKKDNKTEWNPRIPAWAGSVNSDSYYDAYQKACEELGRETRGIVQMWQVSNEMDITVFRGPLSIQQAERFLLAGARGLKQGNPDVKADINPAGLKSGEPLYRALYTLPDTPFDYAGIDGYFGSWAPGGPQDWIPVIEKIHDITRKPVLINEWGYSSLEGSGKPLGRKVGNPVCERQKWNNVWDGGHTPEAEAAYIRIAMKVFATYPNVAGCFFYDWEDQAVCYHCGTKGCPAECGWGLLDAAGKPKPAYDAMKEMAHEYF